MLEDEKLIDAMSAIQHQQEGNLADLAIGDVQFPDSKGVAVHSFSFLFTQQEYMYVMAKDRPTQIPYAMMIS